MSNANKKVPLQDESKSEELYVVELDERLEFGAAIIDSDLQADDNTGCHNLQLCNKQTNQNCHNDQAC